MDTHSPHPKKPQTVTKIIQAHFDNIEKGTFNPNAFSADLQEVPHDNVDYKKCVQTLMKLAKDKVTGAANTKIVTNLEKMTETLLDNFTVKKPGVCEVLFFPSVENEAKIVEHLKSAKKSIHVCMFTITNEHLCTALLEAYLRGVDVKILTDDEELRIMGSNVRDLSEEGIQVRTDASSRSLMHNKFSIIDDKILMTGSYNWTVRATKANQENVVIMDNAELVEIFGEEFNKLWAQFSAQTIKNMGGNQKKKTRLYQRYQDALAKLDKQKAKQELKKKLLKDDEEEEEITGIIVSSKKITKITKDTTQKKPRKLKAIPYGEPEESPESPPQKNFLKTLLPLVYLFALLIITRVLVGTWKGPGMEVESASRAFL